MNTSGFYKNDNQTLLFAPNFVDSGSFYLSRDKKDNFVYPVGGWYWFDNEDSAYLFFNIQKPNNNLNNNIGNNYA